MSPEAILHNDVAAARNHAPYKTNPEETNEIQRQVQEPEHENSASMCRSPDALECTA
jgi:hypothetical protein